jgi:hypothetical protein
MSQPTRQYPRLASQMAMASDADLRKKVTAGMLRDSFVVRSLKRGEAIEKVLRKIGLSESTWEDAKIKHLKLSAGGI